MSNESERDGDVKRQHYVPRLLLRKFSIDVDEKLLNIYLVNQKKAIPTPGPLGKQSYEDYLYGKDQILEKGFGMIEGPFNEILNKMVQGNISLSLAEQKTVKTFVNFQHLRTPEEAQKYEGVIEEFLKINISKTLENSERDYKIQLNKKYDILFGIASTNVSLLDNLKLALLKTPSDIEFVLGQNPVIIINPLLSEKKFDFSKTGIGYKGVLILMPISFEYTLMIYDETYYEYIPSVVNIEEEDALLLNKYQFFTTDQCIYYKQLDKSIFDTLADETSTYRNNPRYEVREITVRTTDGKIENVMNQHIIDYPVEPSFSFIKFNKNAKELKIEGIKSAIRAGCEPKEKVK